MSPHLISDASPPAHSQLVSLGAELLLVAGRRRSAPILLLVQFLGSQGCPCGVWRGIHAFFTDSSSPMRARAPRSSALELALDAGDGPGGDAAGRLAPCSIEGRAARGLAQFEPHPHAKRMRRSAGIIVLGWNNLF